MFGLRRKFYSCIEHAVVRLGIMRLPHVVDPAAAHLIFVCTGNICRSPYAEYVAREYGLNTSSCGVHAGTGLPADATAIKEAGRRSKDLTSHRTTPWDDVHLGTNDIIVALELRHALAVRARARASNTPVVLMSSLLKDRFQILWDPYGRTQQDYSAVFDLIESGVRTLAGAMKSGGGSSGAISDDNT
jgi:protein-tyrosine phosphatase